MLKNKESMGGVTWVGTVLVIGITVPLFACSPVPSTTKAPEALLLGPDGEQLHVSIEIAKTPAEHEKGLMYREHLEENHGMLFVFSESQVLNFWMKNTLIPLDILFFNAKGNFVSGHSMEPCRNDPCYIYTSREQALYALEVPSGFIKEQLIGRNWKLQIKNN
jgi:uncharacterized membrane protein (UPF0127 family)